jgi:hypothetical protein
MIYYGKTLSSSGPKLTAVHTEQVLFDQGRLLGWALHKMVGLGQDHDRVNGPQSTSLHLYELV